MAKKDNEDAGEWCRSCLRHFVQRVLLKVVRWDLLGDLRIENEGIKGVKIGIVSKRKNGLTSERGRTKHAR